MFHLLQSAKNSFAPVNRIPPEVFSLIPDYYLEDNADKTLISLTHVCRGWRTIFTSRASLWIRLDFKNVDKTRAYIQRSRSSPLKLYLGKNGVTDDAFDLVIPHICRLGSLSVDAFHLPRVLQRFRCYAPLLRKLDIKIVSRSNIVLDSALFNGDLSSLHELSLERVITDFPWKNLANLRLVYLKHPSKSYGMTQVLDFLESAPLLHTVFLGYRMPDSSDAPPKRIILLRHLKALTIETRRPHPILLDHLHIPIGASLILECQLSADAPPLLDHLPERSANCGILSHITAINLYFDSEQKFVQLSGPSGSLRLLGIWRGPRAPPTSYDIDRQILCSLGHPSLSTIQRLTISNYGHDRAIEYPVLQTLSSANHLRTLVLTNCENLSFILALDPTENRPRPLLCPKMERLVLHTLGADPYLPGRPMLSSW